MLTAKSLPEHELNQYSKQFISRIEEFGFTSTSVFAKEGPNYTYTTGFWQNHRHPELIVFGLDGSLSNELFWDCLRFIEDGRSFKSGEYVEEIFRDALGAFRAVSEAARAEYLHSSDWYYRSQPFEALQLFWPDQSGRFPWDDGVSEAFKADQPDISIEIDHNGQVSDPGSD